MSSDRRAGIEVDTSQPGSQLHAWPGLWSNSRPQRAVDAASVAAAAAAMSALGACYYLLISPALATATNRHAVSFPQVPLLLKSPSRMFLVWTARLTYESA
jgi:hypothetical protein